MKKQKIFVEVILPITIGKLTYSVEGELINDISIGKRVIVKLGKKKFYTAIIYKIHNEIPSFNVKSIISVIDDKPLILKTQLEIWNWISEYYLCEIGEVMNCAVPSFLKLSSETKIEYNKSNFDRFNFTKDEKKIISFLINNGWVKIKLLEKINSNAFSTSIRLLEKGHINIEDNFISFNESNKREIIELSDNLDNKSAYDSLNKFHNSPKQKKFLDIFFQQNLNKDVILREFLRKYNFNIIIVKSLVKKNIINIKFKDYNNLNSFKLKKQPLYKLNYEQKSVFDKIIQSKKNVSLIFGVTSSGKTELYSHLIDKQIKNDNQVLFLVPEIALTTHLVSRLMSMFGDKIGVFHSKQSLHEKKILWIDLIKNNNIKIVVGARSSLFLPFSNLKLIIVDEEHETSYKQQSPSPRYNARDLAVYMGKIYRAKVILGSATPSIESLYNSNKNKYDIFYLNKRYGDFKFPQVKIINLVDSLRKNNMIGIFSKKLIDEINKILKKNQKVLLFKNRRGFALNQRCNSCGKITECRFCSVSMTYHKYKNILRCHYCGFEENCSEICYDCKSSNIEFFGYGTEKIEENLKLLFPTKNIQRMDYDTTRKKNSFDKIFTKFQANQIDILVGTQMIIKGLDFTNIGLVGIIDSDQLINYPNFRSNERAYQMLTQVAGRAGRRVNGSKVIIQTFQPNHKVILNFLNNNHKQFIVNQLTERRLFKYPPYYKLIHIFLIHKRKDKLDLASNYFKDKLKNILEDFLGPEYPLIERLKGEYHKQVLIKINDKISLTKIKINLKKIIKLCIKSNKFGGLKIKVDVDPF